MKIRKNKIKQSFKNGKTTIGIWNGIPHGYAVEICAGAGFEWVLIDGEHSPYEFTTILQSIQSASSFDTEIVVRPAIGDRVMIKRLLDIGVQTLLVPMVESAEQAQYLVDSMRYPPHGNRGVGSGLARAAQWNRVDNYLTQADDEMCLIVQIETVKGLKHIEEICQVEGVDGVFLGPADLAASMGYLGQSMHPDVISEVVRGISIARDSGKVPGVIAFDKEVAKTYKEAGARFIGVGIDLLMLAKATSTIVSEYQFLK